MTQEDWQAVDRAVADSLELAPAERDAFLQRCLDGREDLIREARSLLTYDADDGPDPVVIAGPVDYANERVGPYRITNVAGEGGMGVVWSAERDDGQFRRRVAVKFLSAPFPSGASLDRFLMERDILAALDHPNIARLLDAGMTERKPYLVMEWVDGIRIDEYCRNHQLHPNDILRLFLQVCDAVEYAHRALVIHRDLKPSNLLVTTDGQVKLLDFGIAKMLEPGRGLDVTSPMSRMLTPEYASPEQLRGERVTTSADVYSLGAVLYELLVGRRPFTFDGKTLAEIIDMAGRTNIVKPSVLRRQLPPEIDAVVLKALRSQPEERYRSVAELAADIDNLLAGRPVRARPSGPAYIAAKFVRRHPMAVAAVTVAIALIVGTAIVATRQRVTAERRFNQLRQLANAVIFEFHDGISALPGTLEVRRQMVRRSLEYLDSLAGDAGGDRELLLELAKGYQRLAEVQGNPTVANLGDFTEGLQSARRARRQLELLLKDHPNDLEAESLLGEVILILGRIEERVEGENFNATRREALQYAESLNKKYPDKETALNILAAALFWKPDLDRGLAIYEQLAERYPQNLRYRRSIATMCRYLAGNYVNDLPKMRHFVDRAIEIDRQRVEVRPLDRGARLELSFDLSMLGSWHEMAGQVERSLEVFEEVRAIRQDLVSQDGRDEQVKDRLLYVLVELGRLHANVKNPQKARQYYEQAIHLGDELSQQNSRPNMQFQQSIEAARKGLAAAKAQQ
jgi:tetratricopeptide (TPR) repeat protein